MAEVKYGTRKFHPVFGWGAVYPYDEAKPDEKTLLIVEQTVEWNANPGGNSPRIGPRQHLPAGDVVHVPVAELRDTDELVGVDGLKCAALGVKRY
jgi:hypothetical protein